MPKKSWISARAIRRFYERYVYKVNYYIFTTYRRWTSGGLLSRREQGTSFEGVKV